MKPWWLIALMLSGWTLSGCAFNGYTAPTSAPMVPPAACLAACAPPPAPTGARLVWEEQVLDWAFDCRRRANECGAWVRAQAGAQAGARDGAAE